MTLLSTPWSAPWRLRLKLVLERNAEPTRTSLSSSRSALGVTAVEHWECLKGVKCQASVGSNKQGHTTTLNASPLTMRHRLYKKRVPQRELSSPAAAAAAAAAACIIRWATGSTRAWLGPAAAGVGWGRALLGPRSCRALVAGGGAEPAVPAVPAVLAAPAACRGESGWALRSTCKGGSLDQVRAEINMHPCLPGTASAG